MECGARAPDFPGEVLPLAVVRDESGVVTGCRHVPFAETNAIIEASGAPVAGPRGSLWIRRADATGNRLLVMWVVQACDDAAEIGVFGAADSLTLNVSQLAEPPCGGGTGLTAVELAFRESVEPEAVDASLTEVDRGGR